MEKAPRAFEKNEKIGAQNHGIQLFRVTIIRYSYRSGKRLSSAKGISSKGKIFTGGAKSLQIFKVL